MPAFVHGHAVVFPDCDFPAGVEAVSAPRRLVIDAGDLAGDVEARVEALFRAWGEGRAAEKLTRRWVKRLGQHVLAPHFSLTLTLGSALGWEEKGRSRSRTTCVRRAGRGRGWRGGCGPARTTSSRRSCASGPGWRGASRPTT